MGSEAVSKLFVLICFVTVSAYLWHCYCIIPLPHSTSYGVPVKSQTFSSFSKSQKFSWALLQHKPCVLLTPCEFQGPSLLSPTNGPCNLIPGNIYLGIQTSIKYNTLMLILSGMASVEICM